MCILICRLVSLVILLVPSSVLVNAAEEAIGGANVRRANDLAEPVPLIDADHPIAAPFVADMDGDGKPELLVGEFRRDDFSEAGIRIYRPLGKMSDLKFDEGAWLQADGRDATVPAFCYTGSAPQVVDFNSDGISDLVSPVPGNQYEFSLRMFPGLGEGRFGKPTDLPCLNSRHSIPRQTCYNVRTLVYDWDGDGALDILASISGGVWVLRHAGNRGANHYAAPEPVVVDGGSLRVALGSLCMADWDGDGRDDLIVGDALGGVRWYRNTARRGEPQLAGGLTLVPPGKPDALEYSQNERFSRPKEISRSARVCVADVTGDGRMDLIVGDWVNATAIGPNPTNDQARALKVAQSQLGVARAALEKLTGMSPPGGEFRAGYDDELERRRQECRSLAHTIQQLQHHRYERHGSVWLFERLAQ